MPFATGAFVLFGLGSVPSGRLGDHWGRRALMVACSTSASAFPACLLR
jgi:MFS family permease